MPDLSINYDINVRVKGSRASFAESSAYETLRPNWYKTNSSLALSYTGFEHGRNPHVGIACPFSCVFATQTVYFVQMSDWVAPESRRSIGVCQRWRHIVSAGLASTAS